MGRKIRNMFFAVLAMFLISSAAGKVSETDCTDGACTGIDHAECDENTKCKCSDGYGEDSTEGSTCVKILGGTCSDNDGCSNVANAVCNGGKCTCDTDFGEKDNVCTRRKVSETDCTDGACTGIDHAECDENTKCKCSDGYEEDSTDGSTCVKKKVSETDCTNGACTGIDNAECDGENTKCKCSDGFEEDSTDDSTCIKILGKSCTDNDGCSKVGNAVCTGTECTCDTAYIEKDSVCILRAVSDTVCTNGNECDDIQHAECDKDQTSPKCKCSDGYEEDSTNKNKCVKILGGTCSDNDGCSNVANAVCTDGKCTCDTDFGEKDNLCTRTVSGTECSENGDECEDLTNSHCDNGKCKCDAGYVMNVDVCTAESAAASIQLGTLTVLLCSLAALIQQF